MATATTATTSKARKWNGSKWLRRDKRLAIYLRDDHTCLYCGADGHGDDVQLSIDHVTPRELGGSNNERNLVTCCFTCNSRKRHLRLSAFIQFLSDRGVDTDEIGPRVRRHTRRKLYRYREKAKVLLTMAQC
jgi:hypothetical protein